MKTVIRSVFALVVIFTATAAMAQPTSEAKRDRAYDRDLLPQREVIPYDHIREADVFWEKRVWRQLDFREKMNLPFTWPVDPFMDFIYKAIMNGELTAYSPLYDDFGEGTALTIEDIKNKYEGVDTTYTYDDETYEEKILLIPRQFDYQNIKKMQIKEDWIFDEETSTLVVRIMGMAPIIERIDPFTGEPIGDEIMFWLYYPDLRNILVRHEVFNEKNSARYITFEDIFEMRYFSSYIIKEDNVYDRFINSYAAGIDLVLESDRIKNEIFEFEHQLWEF
ncbi:MAG: gliding motility protein GldN [Chitinophagales bacterium]|nr:gliding motility protein GldN [Chitinophagales bacterium]HAE14270.1 gliding motility protein GldN [Bacteroidota bacterium]MCB9018803.1 gliding motility protein GldN [Chitinophagales bacterium]MCB9020904.1 gliding motility protein GldN [Chitinophagales bacterium]MCB9031889.1 gliding motility protein GldN [Chitinophagales bacterium]